ncbi:putative KR domain containing protein [Lyophyllum shimeji]|uniref:KR domain containing protein n=1 Tax=Lyophyllum shimeji TaxID=47721 RepID=A0A9P3PRR9_LYOSH|nr:putative KR domain containing protein [Lyophyllum shimeji]
MHCPSLGLLLSSLLVALASLFFYSNAGPGMPTLAAVRTANAAFTPSYKPIAIFVGGTSGIGQGIAEAFARHTRGAAHIVIVGRNRAAADAILAQFPKPKPDDKTQYTHEFVQCDVTLMRNVEAVTKDLRARMPKINFLVMSPGYMALRGRDETEEGLDRKLAVHYYARWKFVDGLLPALRRAKAAGEDARVLSVLSAGHGAEIDLDDLGLKKTFSVSKAAVQAPTYNDLMLQEFAARNPGITFVHAYPGGVRTSILASSESWWIRASYPLVLGLTYPFTTSLHETGEYMLHGLLNRKEGFWRVGSRAEDLGMKNYFGSEEARKRLWEHTVKATAVSSS